MRQPKHVNFYEESLRRGSIQGFLWGQAKDLRAQGTEACAYITPMFDTGEAGGTFQRLQIDGDFSNVKLEIIAAATDKTAVILNGEEVWLEQYFQSGDIPPSEKVRVLSALPHIRLANGQDLLLHDLRGRYFWAYVGVLPMGTRSEGTLRGLRMEFPKNSFAQYLPEVYQNNAFLDRYLGIFQSMFTDAEGLADKIPMMLDYESADARQLEELAGWVGIENHKGIFTTAQLRHLIGNLDLFQGAKGTRRVLESVLELVTGTSPYIVERFQWDGRLSADKEALYRKLYGEADSDFCVILEKSKAHHLPPKEDLEYLIENYCMIGTHFKLVLLEDCCHMDEYCYLDVSSRLSVPETARADGLSLGSHVTVG